jgi:hypothetical protein
LLSQVLSPETFDVATARKKKAEIGADFTTLGSTKRVNTYTIPP